MHACPRFVHLGVAVECYALFLCSFLAYRFEAVFALRMGRTFCQAMEVLWKMRALGGGTLASLPSRH